MKRLIPAACIVLAGACAFASTVETLDTTLLRRACADPWLFRHEGRFYLTQTGATKVRVLESGTLAAYTFAQMGARPDMLCVMRTLLGTHVAGPPAQE